MISFYIKIIVRRNKQYVKDTDASLIMILLQGKILCRDLQNNWWIYMKFWIYSEALWVRK